MSADLALFPRAEARVGRIFQGLARWLAYGGGIFLVGIALVTVVSVIGRGLISIGLSPITGDFELVEAGSAIAIFCFLPWCQLNRGHVTVDVFISQLGPRAFAFLGLVGDALIAAVAWVILWRMYLGFGEKFPYGSDGLRGLLNLGSKPFFPETTYLLEMPVWIPFGLALIGAAFFFIVSLYTVWRALNWVLAGREALR